jgi:hypothetical protein
MGLVLGFSATSHILRGEKKQRKKERMMRGLLQWMANDLLFKLFFLNSGGMIIQFN